MRKHKYGAKPTTVDNIRFASQKEARRYQELKLLEKAGEIQDLTLQPRFELNVMSEDWKIGFAIRMQKHLTKAAIGAYVGDFRYLDIKGRSVIVEDVKGFKTPLYKWKKKHVEAQYGIQIREV